MQGDDVAAGVQLVQRDILGHLGHLVALVQVVGQNFAAEALQMGNDSAADFAGADDAYRAVGQILAHLAGQRVILGGGTQHGLVHLAGTHQHQHDGVVGHTFRRVVAVGYPHAQLFGGLQRDMIVADAAAKQVLYAHPGPGLDVLGQNFAGILADGIAACGLVQIFRAGCAGDRHVVDAELPAELLDIRLLVEGAHLVKCDLHILSSLLQMKM